MNKIIFIRVAALAFLLLTVGCAVLLTRADTPPDDRKVAAVARMATLPSTDLPLSGPVTVRFDDHLVPYVLADDDLDAAFVLGMLHAHLRLGQMELGRRIAAGRLSELAGPWLVDVDEAIRAVGFVRGARAALDALPTDTRQWLDRYAQGVNTVAFRTPDNELPFEFRLFGLEREPWTPLDSLALGRLAGTDVNWLAWFPLLEAEDDTVRKRVWHWLADAGAACEVSFPASAASEPSAAPQTLPDADTRAALLLRLLEGWSKSGSNSMVIGPSLSATGAPLIASDPHLGLTLPNLWFMAGLKSPSYRVVGMMAPGLPVFAFGRTPHLAWGGTNLRAFSSDLVDVSDLPAEAFETVEHDIGVRFWFDAKREVRLSPVGPVITDAELVPSPGGRPLALRWVGHGRSDEVGALLAATRAENGVEFARAMDGFAVPAQNFLYADTQGRIGHLLAGKLPRRGPGWREDFIVAADAPDSAVAWATLLSALQLPSVVDPAEGFVASANNRPTEADFPLGATFAPDARVRRLKQLAQENGRVSVADMMAWQRDTVSLMARDLIVELDSALTGRLPADANAVWTRLTAWDGDYAPEATEPLLFEALVARFAPEFYQRAGLSAEYALLRDSRFLKEHLRCRLGGLDAAKLAELAAQALLAADEDADGRTWGEVHRLRLAHPAGRAPLIGDRYRYTDLPVGGGQETIMKTAHPSGTDEHAAFYGSQARHVSDLSDPDANWFVLLGGQDGRPDSAAFLDQVPLWREGRYIRMPLTDAAIRERFPHHVILGE